MMTFTGHENLVGSAIFSSDSERVLTSSSDTTAKLWDVGSGNCLMTFKGHDYRLISSVFSPDYEKVLTVSERDNTAKLWDVKSGNCVKTIKGHQRWKKNATFSSDYDKVLTALDSKDARLWDVRNPSGECVKLFGGIVDSAVFSTECEAGKF
jgi:WD40 repeat protein